MTLRGQKERVTGSRPATDEPPGKGTPAWDVRLTDYSRVWGCRDIHIRPPLSALPRSIEQTFPNVHSIQRTDVPKHPFDSRTLVRRTHILSGDPP